MGDLSISIQAPTSIDTDQDSLQYLIARITEQRGSFRNLTEESLEEEIKNGANEKVILGEEDVEVTLGELQDVKTKKEEVYKARDEMLKQINQAQQESAMALDFLSLLLSQYAPGAVTLTLSPFLKQTLPLGSLGAEVVQAPEKSESEQQQDEMVTMGWRMQSLNDVADSLLVSAARLDGEIVKETTYWRQVLAVKEKGWSLARLPGEKHTLGVRYGLAEAHSNFRNRSLAALRRDDEGNLSLDYGQRPTSKPPLCVRVLQNGVPIARSSDQPDPGARSESLEQEILDARNRIFDEELDHELHREAQHLANQGVQSADSTILLPYDADKQISIDLSSRDDIMAQEPFVDINVPDTIALFLRMLLSQAHQLNLQQRSQPPIPIREGQRPRPVYAILKPLMEILQHRSHIASLFTLLEGYRKSLTKAGLPLSFEVDPSTMGTTAGLSQARKSASSRNQVFADLLTASCSTKISIYALNRPVPLIIDVRTEISSPSFGTTYKFHNMASVTEKIVYSSISDVENEISHVLQEGIKEFIPETIDAWHGAEVGVELVSKFNPVLSRSQSLIVTLDKRHLSLVLYTSGSVEQQLAWQWCAEESAQGEGRSLREVLGDAEAT